MVITGAHRTGDRPGARAAPRRRVLVASVCAMQRGPVLGEPTAIEEQIQDDWIKCRATL